jgi:uncharacterized membrane protein YphA (DoxX/SURF4 family)
MLFRPDKKTILKAAPIAVATGLAPHAAAAHEAWLLTPDEIATLANAPMPALFTSSVALGLAAAIGCAGTVAAFHIEEQVRPYEKRIAPSLKNAATHVGPVVMRVALATMLGLAGTGGLPRHGTAHWTEPTLLVPDMQLSLVPGWEWLAACQLTMAVLLLVGVLTRVIGLGLVGLSCLGLVIFGPAFAAYAPHFIAPGLIIFLVGGGKLSLDHVLGLNRHIAGTDPQSVWRLAQILVGVGFVYLAAMYKLTQPTLLIAILQHGEMPTFGLSYPLIALIMTGVEIICGTLLITGRLIRPVSLVIIGAISFLALTLGETPLFHANLYGCMILFALIGRTWPATNEGPSSYERALV